jgi:hypothetical protein
MDTKIDLTPPSRSSEDNPQRKELLWEKREEVLLLKWKDETKTKGLQHHKKGGINKKLYYLFGIPNIIIPLVIGSLNGVVELGTLTLTCLMIASSIFAGVSTFMNFSRKSQLHFEFDAKYNELAVLIEKELSIPKAHRIAADVFLEKVQQKFNSLNNYAPI